MYAFILFKLIFNKYIKMIERNNPIYAFIVTVIASGALISGILTLNLVLISFSIIPCILALDAIIAIIYTALKN
jgi:hypothetical protein